MIVIRLRFDGLSRDGAKDCAPKSIIAKYVSVQKCTDAEIQWSNAAIIF